MGLVVLEFISPGDPQHGEPVCSPDFPIALVTLSDPQKRNAMSEGMGETFAEVIKTLAATPHLRAVIIQGHGEHFSAGGDLAMLEKLCLMPFDAARAHMLKFYGFFLGLTELPVPTIAAIEGSAIGAAFCVALACDQIVAAQDAVLSLNFAKIGLHPGMGASLSVPRRVGFPAAAALLYSGRRLSAKEAFEIKLVERVTPRGGSLKGALELARTFASSAPLAIAGLTLALRPSKENWKVALEHEAHQQAISYGSEDLKLGLAAARNKSVAQFSGR